MAEANQLYVAKVKADEAMSEFNALIDKAPVFGTKQTVVLAATTVSFVGSVVALSFAYTYHSGPLLALGALLSLVPFALLGMIISGSFKVKINDIDVVEREEKAHAEYLEVLKSEAESFGIDPDSIESRKLHDDEMTSFTATRDNVPVKLTVEEHGGKLELVVDGVPVSSDQTR